MHFIFHFNVHHLLAADVSGSSGAQSSFNSTNHGINQKLDKGQHSNNSPYQRYPQRLTAFKVLVHDFRISRRMFLEMAHWW